MACSVNVDMSGLIGAISDLANVIDDRMSELIALCKDAGGVSWQERIKDALTGMEQSFVDNRLQINLAQASTVGPNLLSEMQESIQAVADAICTPDFVKPLADRISADETPSLARRITWGGPTDEEAPDLGAIADRLGPKPTDVQCEATDAAWATQLVTQNIAEQINDLGFAGTAVSYP